MKNRSRHIFLSNVVGLDCPFLESLERLIQKAGIFDTFPQALKPLRVLFRGIANAVSLVDKAVSGIREGNYKLVSLFDLLHRKTRFRKGNSAKKIG